jgi:hypothetical protein
LARTRHARRWIKVASISATFRNGTDHRALWTIFDLTPNPEQQIFYEYLDPQRATALRLQSDDGTWGKVRYERENEQGLADVSAGGVVDMS